MLPFSTDSPSSTAVTCIIPIHQFAVAICTTRTLCFLPKRSMPTSLLFVPFSHHISTIPLLAAISQLTLSLSHLVPTLPFHQKMHVLAYLIIIIIIISASLLLSWLVSLCLLPSTLRPIALTSCIICHSRGLASDKKHLMLTVLLALYLSVPFYILSTFSPYLIYTLTLYHHSHLRPSCAHHTPSLPQSLLPHGEARAETVKARSWLLHFCASAPRVA